MKLDINTTTELNNGVAIPLLGFGTFAATGSEIYRAVREALDAGYVHIDTAYIYGNEKEVGAAIKDSGLPREALFITTKLWREDQGYDTALKAVHTSLRNLGLDYLDLYLIHWPVEDKMTDTWKAMETIASMGLGRAVGVSNFTIRLIEALAQTSALVPAVNQVEFTPFLFQKELLEFCRLREIQLEAYSPLTRGRKLDDDRLVVIAKKHGKTTAQVLLRWNLQQGVVTIPKSVTPHRIHENADLFSFELDADDMSQLNAMNENTRMIHPEWAPREWRESVL